MNLSKKVFPGILPSVTLAASALLVGFSGQAFADCERGSLDAKYCDENGDMVADLPADKSEWVNPDTLIFAYTPVEDPAIYVSIVGASGAGKSTLLRCINRLVEPTSGSIKLNGHQLVNLRGSELRHSRRRIGMVFQGFNLIDRLTVMENVLSGRLGYVSLFQALTRRFPQSDIDRAFHLMERVGIAHYANNRADQLSGGERQRVAVVRALMQEPEILLADEPTASLDPKTSQQIMSLLQTLASEMSLPVLINIHNVTQARMYTDRIVGMRHGQMIFDGSPKDFNQDALDAIYGGIESPDEDAAEAGAQTQEATV